MKRSVRSLGLWRGARLRQFGEHTLVALSYLMCMWALIGIPLMLFIALTRTAGANVDGALVLTPVGRWLLYMLSAGTFLGSIIVGGGAKVLLRPRHLSGLWLIIVGVGLLFGLTIMFDQVRDVIAQLRNGPHDDNQSAAAFFAFWLLMVGYTAKAVWDEARDRVGAFIEARIPMADDV